MTNTYIKNGRVILKDRIVDGATVTISDGKIAAIDRKTAPKKGAFVIDAKGCFVSPGFIDCHIHGEPEKIFFNEARHGTTAFLIAESCAPLSYIYKRAESIKEFIRTHPFGPNVLGLRLEGPYISKARSGAQDAACIRKPDVKELSDIIKRCSPVLKLMTIAPELNGAKPLIKLLRKHKIIASIGHSDAAYESAVEGVDAGISHSTHTFNAMSPVDRRDPGVAGAVLLDDRVTAEVILDLIHVHRALFGLLLKLKKRDKVIVVTDSLVSEPPEETTAMGGAYRFKDGRLAGSSLTMIDALKNAIKSANLSLQEALNTITLNPAKLLGVEESKGSIVVGKDADIVVFSKEFDVKMTMIRGRIAFVKGKICAG
ncbi:MAG: N-acetylglucosamine-6-phosphate deacetylase [Candidatus Omnitrophica bacterium]|nr:N-acetylglucosamine-6-phosphate deacetylase [Candidatus Omnitrophota bacterium]